MDQNNKYLRRVDSMRQEIDRKALALGADVHRDLVVPACRKHNMSFVQALGDFWFEKNGKVKFRDRDDTAAAGYPDIADILDVLAVEIYDNQVLGYYVPAVPLQKRGRQKASP